MGVLKAINNVNTIIAPKLINEDIVQQSRIDQIMIELDGTADKSRLGANSILAVSISIAKAAAKAVKLPLYKYINELMSIPIPNSIEKMPTPTFNIINGGKHGTGNLDFQEFHVIPATIKSYHEALQMGEEVYQKLKEVLIGRNASHAVGDEGGYVPNLYTNIDALEIIMEAIKKTKYKFGYDIFLGMDLAATQLKRDDGYQIKDRPSEMTTDEMIDYLLSLHNEYRLLILEDPLAEDDWKGWTKITEKLNREVIIVGDDLLVTNLDRIKKAINEKACSGILVKPNQIGTISETLSVIKTAQSAGFKIIVSHRSGETNDSFVADLAVGVASDYVKFGAPARGERVAKYNRLLEIERELKLL
jgi:enolase